MPAASDQDDEIDHPLIEDRISRPSCAGTASKPFALQIINQQTTDFGSSSTMVTIVLFHKKPSSEGPLPDTAGQPKRKFFVPDQNASKINATPLKS